MRTRTTKKGQLGYLGLRGKVLESVGHEEGILYRYVRFKDKTDYKQLRVFVKNQRDGSV